MKNSSFLKEVIFYALFALLIVIPVRTWIAQPFIVNGSSMDPTFIDGEYLIVDEISYRFENPARGDVVIFKYPEDPSKYFIKRLIGLPGETISVKSDSVVITNTENPSGLVLNEPYINSRTFGNTDVTLASNEYFVMGDNRLVSSDSRVWGPLSRDAIIGRPFVRLLPITKIKLFPGKMINETTENK
jgi:signal peptidase I